MKFVAVDVKELFPPEPMTMIVSALAQLAGTQCLLVRHRRQPFPLYEKLLQAGWAYHCQIHNEDDISLFIYRKSDQQLFKSYFDDASLKSSRT
jgi:hypothetical protein